MLLCGACHKRIDTLVRLYGVEKLIAMKELHEERIRITSSIIPDKRTNVVIFSAPVGDAPISIAFDEVTTAIIKNEGAGIDNS